MRLTHASIIVKFEEGGTFQNIQKEHVRRPRPLTKHVEKNRGNQFGKRLSRQDFLN